MTCPVEDFSVEQAAIPVCQQSEANVALAVPELPLKSGVLEVIELRSKADLIRVF